MSIYVLAITDLHGINNTYIIKADSDNEVADYIKNNVKKLYNPFFEFIVKGIHDMSHDYNSLAVYLRKKYTSDDDIDNLEDDIIKDITKFLRNQTTKYF